MGDSERDNWRRGSPAQRWNSPRGFRGHNSNYGGGGGGYASPRFNHNQGWQQRSPFRYQQNSPAYCSTPINYNYQQQQHQQPYRQHRPHFRGGGGRFNSPKSFHENRNEQQGIDAWVSPAMWDDPWKEFTQPSGGGGGGDNNESDYYADQQRSMSTTQFATDLSISNASENVTSSTSSMLNVSDMIMNSAMESGLEDDEGGADKEKPLPNVSMADLLLQPPTTAAVVTSTAEDEDKTDDTTSLETQASQDLLSLIKS